MISPIHTISEAALLPLDEWLTRRSSAGAAQDALVPPIKTFRGIGAHLAEPRVSELLYQDDLGLWSLDPLSIELIWADLCREHPRTILEFGAGVSTVVLAAYAHDRGARVISIEQDQAVRAKTIDRLADHGLDKVVRIMHAPLGADGGYDVDAHYLESYLADQPIDWLLIDGPCGADGCRAATLPLAQRLCRARARWFLDDALRDAELRFLQQWAARPGITVEGIYTHVKGLARGRVVQP